LRRLKGKNEERGSHESARVRRNGTKWDGFRSVYQYLAYIKPAWRIKNREMSYGMSEQDGEGVPLSILAKDRPE